MRTFRNGSLRVGVATFVGVLVALTGLSVPARAVETEEPFLIVEGAKNVEEHRFGPTYWQISYSVDVEFPWLAIDEPQWQQLADAGWVRCQDRQAGWDSFEDVSQTPARIVHQHMSDWIRGNRHITLLLRYYSSVRGGTLDAVPDNTNQRVFLLFDEDMKGRDTIRWLDLKCP